MSLSIAEQAKFAEEGFLRVRDIVPLEFLQKCRSWVSSLLGCDVRQARPASSRVRTIARAMAASPEVEAVVTAPAVVALVSQLLLDTVFLHPRWILRIVGDCDGPYATPPHQDYPFTQGAIDSLTCWIPLHDVGENSSHLLFLPGSHRKGLYILDLSRNHPLCDVTTLDTNSWVSMPCAEGDLVIFHSLTVHATAAPIDHLTRVSIDVRFQSVNDVISPVELTPLNEDTPQHPLTNDSRLRELCDGSTLRLRLPVPFEDLCPEIQESRFMGSAKWS
jgi:hypothetical protein